jgi:hypothetical protein
MFHGGCAREGQEICPLCHLVLATSRSGRIGVAMRLIRAKNTDAHRLAAFEDGKVANAKRCSVLGHLAKCARDPKSDAGSCACAVPAHGSYSRLQGCQRNGAD